MSQLAILTTSELTRAEAACAELAVLHTKHDILDGELHTNIKTLLNRVRTERDDRTAAERRHRARVSS